MTHQTELFKFAFFPDYQNSIKYLADNLADNEDWDFSDTRDKTFSILKNYLEFTFRKLQNEKKIVFTNDNKFACFNTGLVTDKLEDIFAFFEKYRNPRPGTTVAWCFKAFLRKSDNQIINNFSHNIPDVANYFEKPDLLLFNPKFELIPDIEHIIEDNKERFPDHLKNSDSAELSRYLWGAIDEVKKKVRTNYKLAVPQYY